MAKYSHSTQNSDGSYETRVYTDYTQTAAEGAARVAGFGLGMILELIFLSKITLGGTLAFIGLLVMGASAGWGFFLLLCGGGLIGWWFLQRHDARKDAERAAAHEEWLTTQALRKAQDLARKHIVPPTEPTVALAPDEVEVTRFWTKQGDKALLTNRRLVFDRAGGSVSIVRISDIKGIDSASASQYDATIRIPTAMDPNEKIDFSSTGEAQRVFGKLRTMMLG